MQFSVVQKYPNDRPFLPKNLLTQAGIMRFSKQNFHDNLFAILNVL